MNQLILITKKNLKAKQPEEQDFDREIKMIT